MPFVGRDETASGQGAVGSLPGSTTRGSATRYRSSTGRTVIGHGRANSRGGITHGGPQIWHPSSVLAQIMRFMAYDEQLADRVRDLVAGKEGLTQQGMFGGLAFLINGNMAVAASGQGGLLVRVDAADGDVWIKEEGVMPMVMRGREMHGWLRVVTDLTDPDLEQWVSRGVAYARSLPPKGT
jgi:hypothetical protein